MKIGNSESKFKNIPNSINKDGDIKVSEASSSKFNKFMDRASGNTFEEKMKSLAEDILAQGDKLAKRVDIKELRIYKTLIQEFLNQMVNNSYKFNKNSKIGRRGRQKVFVTVEKINEELESLTEDMLSKQVDNINVLKRIQDIRGLILDMEL